MKKQHLFVALLLLSFQFQAQEQLIPLGNNPSLSNKNSASLSLQRISLFDDTLLLPFIDDFSRKGMVPFDSLWLDSNVYINNNYASLPVTIGIATFDGLNKFGKPYSPLSTQDSVADLLTSRPIDLVVPSGDTSVWLTFFYKPQGLGDVPENVDSLVLQFKDTGNVWNTVWSAAGQADTAFRRVNVRITDPIYLFRGFQFRFYNIATVNGNRDHWHLDYVTLLKNTVANAGILDNALIRPQSSLLTEYSAMPYPHYKALGTPGAIMKTSIEDTIYNIDYGPTSYLPTTEILHDGNTIFSGSTFASTVNSQTYVPFTVPLNSFYYPIMSSDSADFVVKSYFSQTGFETNSFNDTSYYNQRFHNYYSYDDGSAEVAYAISGSHDVSLAYQYDVKILDTLRGVQIYFNPTGDNIANKLFQLTVWSQINVSTNQSLELYRMINQKPDTFDGINAFKTYLFDSTLIVNPGPIWIGFIQNEPQTLYGVGFDRNTDSHDKIFYRLAGSWAQSSIPGSLMMRPLFGKRISMVSVDENPAIAREFSVWPNPAQDFIYIDFQNPKNTNYHFEIYNCLGALVKSEMINNSTAIEVADLNAGVYIARLLNPVDRSATVRKLIVR